MNINLLNLLSSSSNSNKDNNKYNMSIKYTDYYNISIVNANGTDVIMRNFDNSIIWYKINDEYVYFVAVKNDSKLLYIAAATSFDTNTITKYDFIGPITITL